jgi:hypothetical protein
LLRAQLDRITHALIFSRKAAKKAAREAAQTPCPGAAPSTKETSSGLCFKGATRLFREVPGVYANKNTELKTLAVVTLRKHQYTQASISPKDTAAAAAAAAAAAWETEHSLPPAPSPIGIRVWRR